MSIAFPWPFTAFHYLSLPFTAFQVPGLPGHAFFCVLDGHGGWMAAENAERTLLPAILDQKKQLAAYANGGCAEPALLGAAMVAGFLQCDAEMRKAIKRSGTTAVCCFLTPTHFVCANAGDSRAVYCKRAGVAALEPEAEADARAQSPSGMSIKELKLVRHCARRQLAMRHSVTLVRRSAQALKGLGVDFSRVEKSELVGLLESSLPATGGGGGDGVVVALSEDHKPDDLLERQRIRKAGGRVLLTRGVRLRLRGHRRTVPALRMLAAGAVAGACPDRRQPGCEQVPWGLRIQAKQVAASR